MSSPDSTSSLSSVTSLHIWSDHQGDADKIRAIIELLNKGLVSLSQLLTDLPLKRVNTSPHQPSIITLALPKHHLRTISTLSSWKILDTLDRTVMTELPLRAQDLLSLILSPSSMTSPYSPSIWSDVETYSRGLLITVEGPRPLLSQITSSLITSPNHSHSGLIYATEHLDHNARLWIRLSSDARLFYSLLIDKIDQHADCSYSVYKPLHSTLNIWGDTPDADGSPPSL